MRSTPMFLPTLGPFPNGYHALYVDCAAASRAVHYARYDYLID
jgi:hypothetical protein